MTPTKAGEGKTTTLVGLTQGLGHIGKQPVACLREPSLGPVFGIKGGAAGGGMTQVVPMEDLNLHFTGDIHAIGAANNLLAAMLDASILHGNPHKIDAAARRLAPRARHERPRAAQHRDRPRRARQRLPARVRLRHHRRLRGDGDPRRLARPAGPARAARARSPSAQSFDGGKPITAEDLGAAGAMAVLLKDAIKPNLIQTLEGQPCLMHCGPFANIAHGNNSLVADQVGMKIADYVVTESGFGSDMGMEKFFDIVCRFGGLTPSAVVLVTTVRAIKHHGGVEDDPRVDRSQALRAIEVGMANVRRHLGIIAEFGMPAVVAVNRRPGDTNEEVELVKRLALEAGAFGAEANEGFTQRRRGRGRPGRRPSSRRASSRTQFKPLYADDEPIQDKIEAVAKRVYGASDVYFYPEAEKKLTQFTVRRAGPLPGLHGQDAPVAVSSDPTMLNAPEHFTLPVRDIRAYTGAGWLVPLCGDITQMPGLGKSPGRAQRRHRRRGPDRRPLLAPHDG